MDLATTNHTLQLVSEHNARQQTTLDKWSADNITPIVLRFIHDIQKYIFPELASYFLAKMIFWGTYYCVVRLLWCAHTCPPFSLLYFVGKVSVLEVPGHFIGQADIKSFKRWFPKISETQKRPLLKPSLVEQVIISTCALFLSYVLSFWPFFFVLQLRIPIKVHCLTTLI